MSNIPVQRRKRLEESLAPKVEFYAGPAVKTSSSKPVEGNPGRACFFYTRPGTIGGFGQLKGRLRRRLQTFAGGLIGARRMDRPAANEGNVK
jgi:hypothetical protein